MNNILAKSAKAQMAIMINGLSIVGRCMNELKWWQENKEDHIRVLQMQMVHALQEIGMDDLQGMEDFITDMLNRAHPKPKAALITPEKLKNRKVAEGLMNMVRLCVTQAIAIRFFNMEIPDINESPIK